MANELYDLIGVTPTEPPEAIRKAYFRALRQYTAEKDPLRHQELRQAYQVLSDPVARKEYDSRQQGQGEVGRLLESGNAALNREELAEAERHFKRALALSPDSVEAKSKLALVAFQRDDHARAVQLFGELVKANPDNMVVQVENGWVNLLTVVAATDNSPEDMRPEHKRMLLGAQRSFDRCIALEPSNRAGYMGRAKIEYYRNDFAAAETWARKAVECDDLHDFEDFDSLHMVMECRVLQANIDGAVRIIEEVRKVVPDQPEVQAFAAEKLAGVGLQLMNAKVFPAAVAVLKACSSIAPQHEGITELVRVNLHAAEAHEELERMKEDPGIPKPVWGLGVLAVGMYTDEFESEQLQQQFFQTVLSALDEVPAHMIRDALQRTRRRYPNIWQCNDTLLGEVLRVASDNASSQLVSRQQQGCFAGETTVITPGGRFPISSVCVGDLVLGFDPKLGPVWGTVESVRRIRCSLTYVRTDNEVVRVTPNHLFLSATRGLVAARGLYPGEQILAVDGTGAVIRTVVRDVGRASEVVEDAYNLYLNSASNFVAGGLCTCSFGFLPTLRDGVRRVRYAVSGLWRGRPPMPHNGLHLA